MKNLVENIVHNRQKIMLKLTRATLILTVIVLLPSACSLAAEEATVFPPQIDTPKTISSENADTTVLTPASKSELSTEFPPRTETNVEETAVYTETVPINETRESSEDSIINTAIFTSTTYGNLPEGLLQEVWFFEGGGGFTGCPVLPEQPEFVELTPYF